MNKHPICPLPADIRVGDYIHSRDGQRKKVNDVRAGFSVGVSGIYPGRVPYSGRECFGYSEWDCIAVERAGKVIAGWKGALKPAKANGSRPAIPLGRDGIPVTAVVSYDALEREHKQSAWTDSQQRHFDLGWEAAVRHYLPLFQELRRRRGPARPRKAR
jgi:hypothetical protein